MSISAYPKITYGMQNIPIPAQQVRTVLILGQSNVSGADGYHTDLEFYSVSQINTTFGANQHVSVALRAIQYILQSQNAVCQIHAYVKPDDETTACANTIVVTGTATQSKTIYVRLMSNSLANAVSIAVDVTSADTAPTIATNIAAAINASTISPFTAGASTNTVTLTAVNTGTAANDYGVTIQETVTGISFAIENTVAGAGDPDFSDLVTNINFQTTRENFIVLEAGYYDASLESALYARTNGISNNQVLDGVMILSKSIEPSDASTLAASTPYNLRAAGLNVVGAFNKRLSSTPSNYIGNYIFSSAYELAAQYAVIQALIITNNTNIGGFVVNTVSVGQPANAAFPTANTTLVSSATPILTTYGWTASEVSQMENVQFSIFSTDSVNNGICGNFYTLSNDIYYKYLTNRLEYFTVREFLVPLNQQYLAQKNYINGEAILPSQVDGPSYKARLLYWYDILAANQVSDPVFGVSYSGLIDNSTDARNRASDVVSKSIRFDVLSNTLSVQFPITAAAPILYLNFTQQNNLVS